MTAADYAGAELHLLNPEVMFSSNAHEAIVIHKTGGDANVEDVYKTFQASFQLPRTNGNWGRSAHYAIGQDGRIWQFVPEAKGAGANGQPGPNMDPFWEPFQAKYGNLNTCTISIEHCDPSGANNTPLTPAQKEASFNLVAHLCKKYGIPASNIKPHKSIAATACPGTYPMDELIAFVQTGGENPMLQLTDPMGKHFQQTGTNPTRWHCTDKDHDFQVIGGILSFYRSLNGTLGFPNSGEKYDLPGQVYQWFQAGVVVYDKASQQCLLAHLDSALVQKVLPVQPGSPNTADVIAQLHTINNASEAALKDLGE